MTNDERIDKLTDSLNMLTAHMRNEEQRTGLTTDRVNEYKRGINETLALLITFTDRRKN